MVNREYISRQLVSGEAHRLAGPHAVLSVTKPLQLLTGGIDVRNRRPGADSNLDASSANRNLRRVLVLNETRCVLEFEVTWLVYQRVNATDAKLGHLAAVGLMRRF